MLGILTDFVFLKIPFLMVVLRQHKWGLFRAIETANPKRRSRKIEVRGDSINSIFKVFSGKISQIFIAVI